MSSKRAMKQAQKQAYAKHRSNITNSRFELKKKFQTKNKDKQIDALNNYLLKFKSTKNLILVTHYVLISEVLNYGSSSGEIVVSDKNFNIIGTIKTDY